jgi:hypothetical protein
MLDYLFIAETFNGNIIRQTQEDESIYDSTKSAYYNLHKENVKKFSLVGKGHLLSVDLEKGNGKIDGRIVNPPKYPERGAKLELVYYRRVQKSIAGNKITTKIRYYIGWKTVNRDSKDVSFILGID